MKPIRAAVLTISDRCSRGEAEDRSGPAIIEVLRQRLGAEVAAQRCVPDDPGGIAACILEWSRARPPIDLILTTGGTGLSPRDLAPEAARSVIEREHPGLMELARRRCGDASPMAYLSRGIAGTIGGSLVITLPGSPKGAVETLSALLEVLPHAIATLRGEPGGHPAHGRAAG